jgi:hypothetical protein
MDQITVIDNTDETLKVKFDGSRFGILRSYRGDISLIVLNMLEMQQMVNWVTKVSKGE